MRIRLDGREDWGGYWKRMRRMKENKMRLGEWSKMRKDSREVIKVGLDNDCKVESKKKK